MHSNNQPKTVLYSLLGVFFFSCVTYINTHITPPFLLSKGIFSNGADSLELVEMLGYILAGFTLTQLVNIVTNKKIILFSIFILIICTSSLKFIYDYNIFRLNFSIMGIATYSYLTITVLEIIEFSGNKKSLSLAAVFLFWIAGHFTVDYIVEFLPILMGHFLCITFYILSFIITLLHKEAIIKNKLSTSKFSWLVSNIELQLLTGFMISYVTLVILWYYEAYALKEQLALSAPWLVQHSMLKGIFFLTLPLAWLITKLNKYLANLILIITLLVSFFLLPIYGNDININLYLLYVIGTCLYTIFICNILILADKFETKDFKTASLIYFTICAIGMYAGALSSYISFDIISDQGFLFSVYSVIGTFILYYLWYFFRHRLYQK